MAEQKKEGATDSQTGYEDKNTDELKDLLESEQDVEKQKLINRELFGRAKRAEDKLKEVGGDAGRNAPAQGTQKKEEKIAISYEDGLELQASGYNPSEILEIAKRAKRFGVSPAELIQDPTFKAGFEIERKKSSVDSNKLPPSRRMAGMRQAAPTEEQENDSPAIKEARGAFNRNLANKGGESEE